MFCVECGREDEMIGSLCRDCYSKKHVQPSIPDHVDITICAHCSSMLTETGWKDVGSIKEAADVAIEHALLIPKGAKISEMRVKLDEKDERNLAAAVSVLIAVQGHDFERVLSTIVRLKRGSCTECSKKLGNYYEAILQVRGPERSLSEDSERDVERLVRDRVASMRKGSREIFVSKIDHVKGGLDFYFSTIPAARIVARELQQSLCSEFKESSSLWGRRDGKDIYRMTYLVRLPAFSKGDVIDFQDRVYYVRGMSRGVVHGIDLRSGEERAMKIKESGDCELVKSESEILKAVVLIDKDQELQVLDPETMSPLDVKKPVGFSRKGEQVRLVKTKVGAFVLSDSW